MVSPMPHTFRQGLRDQIGLWPARSRWGWWIVRPACTVATVAAGIAEAVFGSAILLGVSVAAIALLVRPVRRPWVDLGLGAAIVVLVPVAGVALVLRSIATMCGIWLAAGDWSGGLQVVARGRRLLADIGDSEPQSWESIAHTSIDDPDGPVEEAIYDRWLATWAEADARALAVVTFQVVRGLLFGRWPVPMGIGMTAKLFRIVVSDSVVGIACRLAAAASAGVGLWWLGLARPDALFILPLPWWVSAAVAAAVAYRGTQRRPDAAAWTARLLVLVVAPVVYGWAALSILAIGAASAIYWTLVARSLERRRISITPAPPRLPIRMGWLRVRDHWRAARLASAENRPRIARQLWEALAGDSRTKRNVRAAAHAALSELALGQGESQRAVDEARRALDLVSTRSPARPQVMAAAGIAMLAAGDHVEASRLLDGTNLGWRRRRHPAVTAAVAQLHAEHDNQDQAHALLLRTEGGLARGGRLDQLIDSEVALALVFSRTRPFDSVEKRLLELLALQDTGGADEALDRRTTLALARGRLLLGRLQLDNDKPRAAADHLRQAINELTGAANSVDHAVGRILLGAGLVPSNRQQALFELEIGIRLLESLRGQLSAGRHRASLVERHVTVYQHAFEAAGRLQSNDAAAARLAAELVESLRRNALALTLRGEPEQLPPSIRELRDHIDALERSPDAAPPETLDGLRTALARKLSDMFASAYLPRPVDLEALRARTGGAHLLEYRVHLAGPARLYGHVVWSTPDGESRVDRVDIVDRGLLDALGESGEAARDTVMSAPSTPAEAQRWTSLSQALLPEPLRRALLDHPTDSPTWLVIVPDASLAALPWCALPLDDGRPLAAAAVIQLVPTLELLAPPTATGRKPRRHFVMYTDPAMTDARRTGVLTRLGGVLVADRAQFLDELSGTEPGGAYVAAHGEGRGLQQHLMFDSRTPLSAASALAIRWPAWTIFAACLVGRIESTAGEEPLGLPIACLLGGAQTVIGGVLKVNNVTSDDLLTGVLLGLLAGQHPAAALRAAQIRYLAASPLGRARPDRWAGFVCLSRTPPAPAAVPGRSL